MGAGPAIHKILDAYKGNVRLVLKMYPYKYRDFSSMAAEAALSAWEQGRFEAMHKLMLENSPRLDKTSLLQYGRMAEMDVKQLEKNLAEMRHMKQITADLKLATEVLDLYNTPAFYINGRRHLGNRPYEYWERVINEELKRLGIKQGK